MCSSPWRVVSGGTMAAVASCSIDGHGPAGNLAGPCVEFGQRGGQTRRFVVVGRGDDVEVLRRAPVAVYLDRHAADDRVVDGMAVERRQQLAQVQRGGRGPRLAGQRAAAPAISSCVATRFHDADSASRCAGVRRRACAMSPGSSSQLGRRGLDRRTFAEDHEQARRSARSSATRRPDSMRLIAACVVPARRASDAWVTPWRRRAARSSSPRTDMQTDIPHPV